MVDVDQGPQPRQVRVSSLYEVRSLLAHPALASKHCRIDHSVTPVLGHNITCPLSLLELIGLVLFFFSDTRISTMKYTSFLTSSALSSLASGMY